METKLGTTKCPIVMKKTMGTDETHNIDVDVFDLGSGIYRLACPMHNLKFKTQFKNTLVIV